MDTQQEAILQAVILAEPFEHQSRYGPLVRGGGKDSEGCQGATPWASHCLLPFCNAPLIAWTLESLFASSVKNAFIVIREGGKELQEYLDSSTFTSPTAEMNIRIRQTQAYSEGDVMREVDGLALTGDWLLVRAGYMGNLDLGKAVEDFTARRKKEQGLIMDCLVAQKTRAVTPKISTHIMTPQKQLLHFMHNARFPRRKRAHFPLELLEGGKDLVVRTDLESVGVDICNMEVPALFVENFDYQNMRPDFINGVLTSDLLGKSIRCTVVGERGSISSLSERAQPWAAHVGDLASYAQISKSVVSRWSYPLVLDETIPGTSDHYEQRRNRFYLGKRPTLSRSCTVGPAAVIGHRTFIGDHSNVSHSIVGQNCKIASNVVITNSYIHDGTSIEDGCIIRDSILAEGVKVKSGAVVVEGCLIGPGVTIGEAAKLHGKRVSTEAWEEEAATANGVDALGSGSQGHIWPSEEAVIAEEQDSDDEDALDPRNLKVSQLRYNPDDAYLSSASSASIISRSSSSSSLASQISASSSRASGMTEPPAIAGIGALNSSDASDDAAFEKECTSSLERSFGEGHTVENTAIELKTLRMASNVPLKKVIGVVVPYMCRQVKLGNSASAGEVANAVNGLVERWGDLVSSLTSGQESGMVEVLLFLQEHCATASGAHPRLFPAFLQAYYQEDVVSEEAVRSWVTNPVAKSTGGEAGTKLWQTGAAFMRALMEAEDDDDDDEEEEDSDDE